MSPHAQRDSLSMKPTARLRLATISGTLFAEAGGMSSNAEFLVFPQAGLQEVVRIEECIPQSSDSCCRKSPSMPFCFKLFIHGFCMGLDGNFIAKSYARPFENFKLAAAYRWSR